MTRITKNELVAQLAAQGKELEQLRAALGDAKHDLERVTRERDELRATNSVAANEEAAPRRGYTPRPRDEAFAARCQAARELAMKTGRCVKLAAAAAR